MFQKFHLRLLTSVLIANLLFSPVLNVSAQSFTEEEPGVTAAGSPAATETVVEATATLDSEDMRPANVSIKESVQETEKLIPNDTDFSDGSEVKRQIFLPLVSDGRETVITADAAATNAYWRTIEYETFEGNWPDYGWRTYDCNGANYGERYWDDESYKPYAGSWSGWPAGGGANALNPRSSYYPNNSCAWMIYGPFSLAYAQSANLSFKYWNQSEANYDYFGWYYSCDGSNFTGYRTSGDSAGWRTSSMNLGCRGDSSVWIGFKFTSDGSYTDDGPFVDNILLQEYR